MTVTISGTDGITTPGLTNTGTETLVNLTTTGNTTLGDASTDTLNVGNGGLIKDASGNVGIGTTSPSTYGKFVTYSSGGYFSVDTNGQVISAQLLDVATAGGRFTGYSSRGALGAIHIEQATTSADGGYMTFRTCASGSTTTTERARIDSSGNLLVGTTTFRAKISDDFNGSTNNGISLNDTASANGTAFANFYNNGSLIGSITRVGATSAVVYNTTSDVRLKSNIEDASLVLSKLMQVQVRQFDWTEGQIHQDYGFIAQELEPVLSGIVTKGKTEEDVWQLDYSRLTPHLVKAIQEQQALITTLTDRITALEAK